MPPRLSKEELIQSMDRVDREITMVEQQISKLKKKQVRAVGGRPAVAGLSSWASSHDRGGHTSRSRSECALNTVCVPARFYVLYVYWARCCLAWLPCCAAELPVRTEIIRVCAARCVTVCHWNCAHCG